jgi:hypothetical protein
MWPLEFEKKCGL